jgi:capsular polysaccharide transport system permease protein
MLALLGFNMSPENLLLALFAWFSLWLLGLGSGMVLSVVVTVVPDISKITNVMTLPLMILSGAFIPVQYMPYAVQQILLYNPVLHTVETIRLGYFSGYWTMPEVSMFYVYQWILPILMLGLLLQLRFEMKLKQT